jgi:hypothetical protein
MIRATSSATGTGSNNGFHIGLDGDGLAYLVQNENQALIFSTNATERMRILAGGRVCIGATTGIGTEVIFIKNGAGDTNNPVMNMQAQATSVATTMIGFYDGANTFQGQIYIDPVTNTTVYATSSDYRLKENVAPMTGSLDKVAQLKPVTYKWKNSDKNGQGFIAHELKEVVPECVIGEKDAVDKDGNIMPQMVDISFLVATLTAAIQEQQQIINDLKANSEAQQKRIEKLEELINGN